MKKLITTIAASLLTTSVFAFEVPIHSSEYVNYEGTKFEIKSYFLNDNETVITTGSNFISKHDISSFYKEIYGVDINESSNF